MNRILIFFFLLLGCNVPYAEFQYSDKTIFVCGENTDFIITDMRCSEKSSDHIVSTDNGITGGMSLFVNLCDDNYEIIAFGYFEVIGDPKFQYSLRPWSKYIAQKDSLISAYDNQKCKFRYSE